MISNYITSHCLSEGDIAYGRYLLSTCEKTHRGLIIPERLCVTTGIGSRFIRETPKLSIYQATEHPSVSLHYDSEQISKITEAWIR